MIILNIDIIPRIEGPNFLAIKTDVMKLKKYTKISLLKIEKVNFEKLFIK